MNIVHYDFEKITLNGNEYSFSDFKKLEPDYSTPFGFPVRVYRSGSEHYVTDGSNTIFLPIKDEEMERICNREGELVRLIEMLKHDAVNPPNGDHSVVHHRRSPLKQKISTVQSPK